MKTKDFLILFITVIITTNSCSDEVMKNRSRKGLGENVGENSYGIVIKKWEDNLGLEINHKMELQVFSENGNETIFQLITEYDYESIEKGDTIRQDSSRNWWLKNYGKQPKEGWKEMFIYGILTILVFVLSAIVAERWENISFAFTKNKIGYIIGNLYDDISAFFNKLILGDYGIAINIVLIISSVLIVNLIIALFLYELIGEMPKIFHVIQKSSLIIAFGILMMLFNGLNNFSKNIRVLAVGTIIFGALIAFFHFGLGLKMGYMLKSMLDGLNNNN